MLSSYPRILSCTNHFAAQFNKISASDDSEWNVLIHRVIDFCYSFIIGWKVINVNAIRLKFFVDFCLHTEKCLEIINRPCGWMDAYMCVINFKRKKAVTLNFASSVLEIVSALAIIGMMLTFVSSFFMQTRSNDFNP